LDSIATRYINFTFSDDKPDKPDKPINKSTDQQVNNKMAFEVEGRLHRIFPTEQKSASFSAREFVLEVPDGNYPQLIKFQTVQDKCAQLDHYREGERVKVSFDLRGREWNGKFLTNLNAWRIDRGSAEMGAATAAAHKTRRRTIFRPIRSRIIRMRPRRREQGETWMICLSKSDNSIYILLPDFLRLFLRNLQINQIL
jgi:single-strand DNA-binding protein